MPAPKPAQKWDERLQQQQQEERPSSVKGSLLAMLATSPPVPLPDL